METLTLETVDANGTPNTGLHVQVHVGPPPQYSEVLYRLYLVQDRATDVVVDGRKITLLPNHMLTLSPGEQVQCGPEAKLLSCAFHHDFFCVRVMRNEVFCDGVVFNRLRGLPVVDLQAKGAQTARMRFQEIADVIEDESLFKTEYAVNILRSLLLQAADCKIRFSDPADIDQIAPNQVSNLVTRFQDLVEQNYAKHLDMAEYCDMLGVTVATLNRHVKNELGQTAKQVAQERLALEARVALRTGTRSVKEVAFDLGFDDPLYFSRFFRKQFGTAPTQYFAGSS